MLDGTVAYSSDLRPVRHAKRSRSFQHTGSSRCLQLGGLERRFQEADRQHSTCCLLFKSAALWRGIHPDHFSAENGDHATRHLLECKLTWMTSSWLRPGGDNGQRPGAVLLRFCEHCTKLRSDKCSFGQLEVTYLEHQISAEGLQPTENLDAVLRAREPTNVSELRFFLDFLTYYSKFLPNMATLLRPLYDLLAKDSRWKCGPTEKNAFDKSKYVRKGGCDDSFQSVTSPVMRFLALRCCRGIVSE